MCTLKTFPIENTPNGRELWQSISGNFDRFSEIICEFVDNALSNFRKYALDPQTSRKVRIVLREQESWVDVDVMDTGTGIRNIHAALTLGSRCGAESPLNEHGMGLKHALASVDDEGCVWSIQTRTPEDNELDRHLLVEGPYGLEEAPMMGQYRAGWGKLIRPTGTAISFRCTRRRFETLRPVGDRAEKSFDTLVEILVEELAYTYAQVLQRGEMTLEVDGGKRTCVVHPLFPIWDKDGTQEIPAVTCDLGGGPVELVCRYGLIRGRKETFLYYKGNMESSGVEIRCNGRVVQRGLFRRIWNGRVHPSRNHFLVQVDLRVKEGMALPATKPTKTGFWDGDPRLEALFAWIRSNVPLPAKEEPVEKRLVRVLAQNKAVEDGVLRVAQEKDTYRSLNLGTKMDLFVSYRDRTVVYEAKKAGSRALDVYQLRMYWDGCALDGQPITQGMLIARRHCPEVEALVEKMNSFTDPTGRPYQFLLTTWEEEGIDPCAV